MSEKRKHKTLSFLEKTEVIKRLKKDEKLSHLAHDYGVDRATIYDIHQNSEKILTFVNIAESGI